MSSKKNRTGWWRNYHPPEESKAHEEIPDGLGIGVLEERDHDGQITIFFRGSRLEPGSHRVILGRYRSPDKDGKVYYVVERTGPWVLQQKTFKFEHILEAIGFIHTLKEKFDGGSS